MSCTAHWIWHLLFIVTYICYQKYYYDPNTMCHFRFLSCNRWHFIMAGSTWHNLLSANCVFILSLLNSLIGSLSIHLKGEVYIMEKVYLQTNLKKNFSNLLCYNLFISYYHLAGRGNSYKLVLRNCILSRIYSCLLTTKLERPLFWWLHWVQHSIFMSLSSTC